MEERKIGKVLKTEKEWTVQLDCTEKKKSETEKRRQSAFLALAHEERREVKGTTTKFIRLLW